MNTNGAGQGCGLAFRWLGPIIVLSGGIFIGFAPILMRYGLGSLGPQSIAFWRFTLAIPILLLMVFLNHRRWPRMPNRFVVMAGTFFACNVGFWHWALTHTSVASSTFIVNLGNIGVGLVAWIILKDRPTPVWGLAATLAVIGAAALSLGALRGDGAMYPSAWFGDLLAICAAVFVSCYMVASKVARRNLSGVETIFWLTVVEAFVAAILVTVSGESWLPDKMAGLLLPLMLAIVVQVIGQGLIITGLGHTPAGIAGILVVAQPVVASFLSWHLFHEVLTVVQTGGCVLIISGILLAQAPSRRRDGQPQAVADHVSEPKGH